MQNQLSHLAAACGLLTLVIGLSACATPADPEESSALGETVQIQGGMVQGARLDSGVMTFQGIPFAAPPTGDLRWRPPQPVVAWDDTRDAKSFSPVCWQPQADPESFYGGAGDQERSEDCLYLNVWSGAETQGANHPVMVWIHGGGLQTGSGSTVLYDGDNFAQRGVVLVTINYRLGPMGFLAHPDLSAENTPPTSGNFGVQDQVAALEWVKNNIDAFGGDSSRITIFGESAGSWSVNYMTATPLAAGLFQRAIGHSGGIFWPMTPLRGEGSAEANGERLATAMGATNAAEMRSKSPEEIFAALAAAPIELVGNHDGYVFPKDIHDIFAAGEQNDVDTIVGFNSDEGTALFAAAVPGTLDGYKGWLSANYPGSGDAFLSVYPASTDEESRVAGYENMADRFFAWQMRTWAQLQTSTGSKPVHKYYFTRVPPWDEGQTYGAYHAAEIIYAFDNMAKSSGLRAEIGPFNHEWNETDRSLAQAMNSYWINFAKTGDPNGEGLPVWPLFDPETDRALEFGDEILTVEGVLDAQLDANDAFYEATRAGG